MSEKLRYLSCRLFLCAGGAAMLFLGTLAFLWVLCFRHSLSLIPALLLTLLSAGYCFFVFRWILLPYRETKKIYEQFAMGYVLNDLFHLRHPLTPESDRAVLLLNEMIDKNHLINASKKQAEYLALQNQINPHFLYNTLEGIRSEALLAGLDSVAEMTEALATFFRYTISQVENLVTLEDELANIENYYYIQQFRFGDKLALHIQYEHDDDLSELEILKFRLPKLTLQPIMENSIYHGIERKIGKGNLVIRICVSDDRLRIRISDDGMGMAEEKLKHLNEKLRRLSLDEVQEEGGKKGGIALINVNNRIKLLFGEEYGIIFYSREGAGTDALITLPLVRETEKAAGIGI
ncbi:sensor histidine kinase [Clostridiaceae bacterium]|nr:sensor histidine kinase [Clostridiaceae bacterium]RKI08715.1 sensor histidine kinase [bacterium 1XD21-70]